MDLIKQSGNMLTWSVWLGMGTNSGILWTRWKTSWL